MHSPCSEDLRKFKNLKYVYDNFNMKNQRKKTRKFLTILIQGSKKLLQLKPVIGMRLFLEKIIELLSLKVYVDL